ncbi:hypothetical protein BTN33_02565 [Aeromonas veronii]|nr:hypothetical protein BTN33_02565 [Aeromonas veronii]
MNIRDRLVLSAQLGKIALIREGLFLRCYQQSLFSLFRLQQDVKVVALQLLAGRVHGLGVNSVGWCEPSAYSVR